MEYRKIGNSGIDGSAIALGTWAIGGGDWWGNNDDVQSIEAIHSAVEAGVNLIDTAPVYGMGKSETIVGQAIKKFKRSDIVIASKVGLWWNDERGTDFFSTNGISVRRCLEPDTIKQEIELSLERLGTDYIDVYFTHWQSQPPHFTPIEKTMNCLMDLKSQGLIKSIGASNVDREHIEEYIKYGDLDVIQERYSIVDRKIEDTLLPSCLTNNIAIFAYSPLEQGLLTGVIKADTDFAVGDTRSGNQWIDKKNRFKVLDMIDSWSDLTKKYNCSLTNLVVAWSMTQTGMSHILCGARKAPHILEAIASVDIKLTSEDAERMRNDAIKIGEPL